MQIVATLLLGIAVTWTACAVESRFTVDGIRPGMTKVQVTKLKGSPVRVLVSDFGPTWIFPNAKSHHLTMVQFANGSVRGVSGSDFLQGNKYWDLKSRLADFAGQHKITRVRSVPIRGEEDSLDFNEFVVDGSKVDLVTRGKDHKIQYYNLDFKEP